MVSEWPVNGSGITTLMHAVMADRTTPAPLVAELAGRPASVGSARRLTACALAGCPRADDLVTAVSELAANAVRHSASGEGGTFTVRVRVAPRWARVEVTDSGPALLPPGPGSGMGLIIVAGICDRSGAAVGDDGSRTVFAEATWRLA